MEGSVISAAARNRRKLAGIWIVSIAVSIGVVLTIGGIYALFTEQECVERFGTCQYPSIPVTAWLPFFAGVLVLGLSLAAFIIVWKNWRV